MEQLTKSIINWLQADDDNVAVVHCRNQLRWTALVVAAFLCEIKQVDSVLEGLRQVDDAVKVVGSLAQMRYATYLDNLRMIGGLANTNHRPLRLQRVLIQTRPFVGADFTAATLPYMDIWAANKLVYSTTWKDLSHFEPENGFISLSFDVPVQGDVVRFPLCEPERWICFDWLTSECWLHCLLEHVWHYRAGLLISGERWTVCR